MGDRKWITDKWRWRYKRFLGRMKEMYEFEGKYNRIPILWRDLLEIEKNNKG